MKPKNCIYPDCFNCILSDCLYDELEQQDIVQQNIQDKEIAFKNKLEQLEPKQRAKVIYDRLYEQSEKGKARRRLYSQSEAHRIAQKKYFQTEKGKAAQKRYKQSEKGKAAEHRKNIKRIETGKNAIYCKRYRQKKKREAILNEQIRTTKISGTNDEGSVKQAEE